MLVTDELYQAEKLIFYVISRVLAKVSLSFGKLTLTKFIINTLSFSFL